MILVIRDQDRSDDLLFTIDEHDYAVIELNQVAQTLLDKRRHLRVVVQTGHLLDQALDRLHLSDAFELALEESRVLDRNGRLRREEREELDVILGEALPLRALHVEDADDGF